MLRNAPQFLLDNPVALQKRYLGLEDRPANKEVSKMIRRQVLAGEKRALEMLVNLFDWLDSLKSQPTTEIVYLYDISQSIDVMITDTLAQMDQAATMKAEIDELIVAVKNNSTVSSSPCSCLEFSLILVCHRTRILPTAS